MKLRERVDMKDKFNKIFRRISRHVKYMLEEENESMNSFYNITVSNFIFNSNNEEDAKSYSGEEVPQEELDLAMFKRKSYINN